MLLSRPSNRPQNNFSGTLPRSNSQNQFPDVHDFLGKRDFVGALTLLEFQRSVKEVKCPGGVGYCSFHLCDFRKALEEYESLLKREKSDKGDLYLNIACCLFSLGLFKESASAAEKGKKTNLKTRLLFHLAHKLNDEDALIEIHRNLDDTLENQLSLASIHYLRNDYQSAIDIYKRILLDNRYFPEHSYDLASLNPYHIDLCMRFFPDPTTGSMFLKALLNNLEYLALNVYVALCYHRLEYYDVSQEVLSVYLQAFPDSAIALNLRACNSFRLYSGSSAEKDLKPIINFLNQEEHHKTGNFSNAFDLIRHNLVVFRNGEGALQVLPKLIDLIPEARLNLIIYYLHIDDVGNASALMKEIKPKTIPEFIVYAIVNVLFSHTAGSASSREYLVKAQNFFNRIGSSESEQDSVFGRLCMASAHFLNSNFDHCALYLNSVRTHYYSDDTFNFNYAQAKTMLNQFQEAEELFNMIQSEKLRTDFTFIQCIARCYIMNKKPRLAWDLFDRMETSPESFQLLQLIANECYKMGQFYYAAKAFDLLERFDPSQEHWEGKRGACVGVFQLIIAGHEPKESLPDIIALLRNSSRGNAEKILMVIKKWARDNRINL